MKPKQPNSALRKIVKLLIKDKTILAYIPGEKGEINKHSSVLVIPKSKRDCPGINYSVIRGAEDVKGVKDRKRGRSKYGTKKI